MVLEVEAGDEAALAAAVGALDGAVLAGLELGLAQRELVGVRAPVLVLLPGAPLPHPHPVRAVHLQLLHQCPRKEVGPELGPGVWTRTEAGRGASSSYVCVCTALCVCVRGRGIE